MNKDKAFNFLCNIAEGISLTFGKNCETVVHDLSSRTFKILAIYNGHVSGREVGSEIDIYGNVNNIINISDNSVPLDLFKNKSFINNLVLTNKGKKIKSSTFPFISEDFSFALGINFEITAIDNILSFMHDFSTVQEDLSDKIYDSHCENQLEDLFAKAVSTMGKPVDKLNKKERIHLISILKDKSIFNMQKSIPFVSEKLGVSRYTIYNYLNEIENKQ